MNYFTVGNRDVDKLILLELSDSDFDIAIKSWAKHLCDDDLFMRRISQKYNDKSIITFKENNVSYQQYYDELRRCTSSYINHEFNYQYLPNEVTHISTHDAAIIGSISILKWGKHKYPDICPHDGHLSEAIKADQKECVKWIINNNLRDHDLQELAYFLCELYDKKDMLKK